MIEKVPVIRAWEAITAAIVAIIKTGQNRGEGTALKNGFATRVGSLRKTAPCPIYCSSRAGSVMNVQAKVTEPTDKWPTSAYIASTPVIAKKTAPKER